MSAKNIKSLKKVKNIEVTFLDINNKVKVLTIPKSRLSYAIKNGLKFDGSSISKMKNVSSSDMKLFLDLNSQYLLPNENLLVFANTDYNYDARKNLLQLEQDLKYKNIKVNVGAELEFFLFDYRLKTIFDKHQKSLSKNQIKYFLKKQFLVHNIQNYSYDRNINQTITQIFDNLKYFDCDDDKYFKVLNDITEFCEGSKIKIEQFHHECGNNQFEIDFKYDSPTKTADNVVYLKKIITFFAKKYELFACFLPKPLKQESGSGMHINISAYNGNNNIFYNPKDKFNLSVLAYNFVDGIFKHINSITAIANPIKNSYQRLLAGCETPTKIYCNLDDRTSLIRIPSANELSTRIELRSPDISCNPYLTFLAVINSGFEFLLDKDFKYKKNKYTKQNKLPKNLKQAKKHLKNDVYLSKIVPQIFCK